MRIEKSGTRYFSFAEMADSLGIKSTNKKSETKLKEQRDKFNGYHKCPACKKPMDYIGGNILVCKNESCRGIKHVKKNEDGDDTVWYSVAYEELNDKFANYANYIFN